MMNLATKFYTFRHTAVLVNLIKPDTYTDINFGDINPVNGYVIAPYLLEKTQEKAPNFTNADKFYAQALVQINDETKMGVMEFGIVHNCFRRRKSKTYYIIKVYLL